MDNRIDRTPPSRGVRSFFKNQLKSLLLLLVLLLAGSLWYASQLVLAILPENGQALAVPVRPGDVWRYHYKHSVQQTPCDEYFRVEGPHAMTMTHTIYESFGVGLPYDASEGQFVPLKEKGKFEMILNRPYSSVTFRTAVQARPALYCKDRSYDLCTLYGQGTKVSVTVMERYAFWLSQISTHGRM